jgi:hypothetical protein
MKTRKPVVQSRQRKVDVQALDADQLMLLSSAIGREVAKIMSEAKAKVQSILDVYDMNIKMQYCIEPKDAHEQPKDEEKVE